MPRRARPSPRARAPHGGESPPRAGGPPWSRAPRPRCRGGPGPGDALLLVLLERRHLPVERALRPFEVGFPGAEPLLDAALDLGEGLGESLRELALPDGELPTALVGEPPLLRRVRRDSVGVRTRDRDAELLRLRRGLLLRGCTNGTPRGERRGPRFACCGRSRGGARGTGRARRRGRPRARRRGSRPGRTRGHSRSGGQRGPPRGRRKLPRGAAARSPPAM